MVKLNWGLSLYSKILAAWQKKLKEPADQLKYYSSKCVWMTAKVLELFCHEICFKTGRTGKFSVWKRLHDEKPGNQAHYSHPIKPTPPCSLLSSPFPAQECPCIQVHSTHHIHSAPLSCPSPLFLIKLLNIEFKIILCHLSELCFFHILQVTEMTAI